MEKNKNSKTVHKNNETFWLHYFLNEFEKESDRAAVILSCALIDDTLKELLLGYMISNTTSNDTLFDGANAPLSTFSARIDCSYRLGIITNDFANGLHTLRRIRNSFAHDIVECTFKSIEVRDRIVSITKLANITKKNFEETKYNFDNPRDKFCFVVGYFLWILKIEITKIKKVSIDNAIDCKSHL